MHNAKTYKMTFVKIQPHTFSENHWLAQRLKTLRGGGPERLVSVRVEVKYLADNLTSSFEIA